MTLNTANDELLQSEFELKRVKRFKGFLQVPKALIPTLSVLGISQGAIIVYLTIACSTYFGKQNDAYGRSPFTATELSTLLGSHRNSISKWVKELEYVGLLLQTQDKNWLVVSYEQIFLQFKLDDGTRLANHNNFKQKLTLLFPKLTEKNSDAQKMCINE